MSRIAVHYWQNRIAPVFDVGGCILLVDRNSGQREEYRTHSSWPFHRAGELRDLAVETLICGAISRPMRVALDNCGIQVVGFVAGELEHVLTAWEHGALDESFIMPGCGRCGGDRNHPTGRRRLCHAETVLAHEDLGHRQHRTAGRMQTRVRRACAEPDADPGREMDVVSAAKR